MSARERATAGVLAPGLAVLVLTAAYCWIVWLGTGAYLAWIEAPSGVAPTWVTALTMQASLPYPFHAIVLQSFAVISLAANAIWALVRTRRAELNDPLLLPVACHVALVVTGLCLAGAGMLAPLVDTAAVLR
jgi:hypothetical protein